MAIQSIITVKDIKRDLKQLNKLAPTLRREITKDFRAIMQPVISDARAAIPATAPLSGFNRKWRNIFPWNKATANSGINIKIDTRRARKKNIVAGLKYESVGAFVVLQKNAAGMVFDMAGRGGQSSNSQRRNGTEYPWQNTLIENLDRASKASRTMYPAAEKNEALITSSIDAITKSIELKLQQAIFRSTP